MGIIVQKFGGSSVADPERIRRVAKRVAERYEEGNQVVVVVSAMGDTTDHLIDLAKQLNDKPPARELDMLLSTGEQQTIALLSMTLAALGYNAISLTGWQAGITTEMIQSKARILRINCDRLHRELDSGRIAVVAGFQGISEGKDITTLGRGGSDTTAVALAAALGAEVCDIFTDVDGVYSTDPRLVPQARKLDVISYDEMLELATLGAGVLHPRCVEVGKQFGVNIHVRSSFNYNTGTMVREVTEMEKVLEQQILVSGVAFDRNVAKVTVFDVPDKPGTAAEIFHALAREHINVDMIIQGAQRNQINTISFTISRDDVDRVKEVLSELKKKIHMDSAEYDVDVAKVSIVGAGMITNPGVAATMFDVLSAEKINIELISTSEIKVSCAIYEGDVDRAVKALHTAFGLDQR